MADDPLADPSKIDKSDGAKPRVSMGLSGNIQPHPYSNKARPTNYFDIDSLVQSFHGGEGGAKSWSRIVVTKVLQRFEWYFPKRKHKNNPDPPSLEKAWAYYEHVTLPRRYVGSHLAGEIIQRAQPGEKKAPTELYDPFCTPQSAFVEWGTGMDLYFISLKCFAAILFVAGLINIRSIYYYQSPEYNGDAAHSHQTEFLLWGSAICKNTAWVVCEDCSSDQWSLDKSRFATAADGTTLVLRNLCQGAAYVNGYTSFATLIFLLISFYLLTLYLNLRDVRFDEDKMTATDYSLIVENPPKDALDPDEWRDFMEVFSPHGDKVTVVTIALNNQELLNKLIKRRQLRRKLRLMLPRGFDIDDEEALRVEIVRINREVAQEGFSLFGKRNPDKLLAKIDAVTQEIKKLQKKKYTASKVFVTFETEEAQRAALEALSVGKVYIYRQDPSCLPKEYLFRGTTVLKVKQPSEPNAIRWLDLPLGTFAKLKGRLLTLALTGGLLAAVGTGITRARNTIGPSLSGPLTSISNVAFPHIIKLMMALETHSTEGGYQASLYMKVTLFRWTLSAFLAQIISPFTSTLEDGSTDLLPTIANILLADVYIVPILKFLNIGSNIRKHLLGPRATTQDEMNNCFQGSAYNLGERYTDMTKVLFVVLYYSPIFPAGFFFGALILTLQIYIDRFSLMRLWGWNPLVGTELAQFSRTYFFPIALVVMAASSSLSWAQFPYDNICDSTEPQSGQSGTYTGVQTLDGDLIDDTGVVYVEEDDTVRFCSQHWRDAIGLGLLSRPSIVKQAGKWSIVFNSDMPWMDKEQDNLTTAYGWVAFVVVTTFGVLWLLRFFHDVVLSWIANTYEPEGDSQKIDFSSDPNIFGYVPQVKVKGFPFPFIVCNIDQIDHNLLGWEDKNKNFDEYNLIYDVPHHSLSRGRAGQTIPTAPERDENSSEDSPLVDNSDRSIYSLIEHYPTEWQLKLAKEGNFALGRKN